MINEEFQLKANQLENIKDGIQALKVDINEKNTRKEELIKIYEEKKREIENAEKDIKNQINELTQKCDTDDILHKSQMNLLLTDIKKAKAKLVETYKKCQELAQEKEKYEKILLETRSEADGSYSYKVAKFKSSLAPIEDAARSIENQRERLEQKIASEKVEYDQNENCLGLLIADLEGRKMQKAEFLELKKSAEQKFNEFKKKYSDELNLFFKELEIESQLQKAQNEKKKIEEKVKINENSRLELMENIKENEEMLNKLEEQNCETEKELKNAICKNLLNLQNFESNLSNFCKLDQNEMQKIILDEYRKSGSNIEKAEFLAQLHRVNSEISKLTELHMKNADEIRNKISQMEGENQGKTQKFLKEEQIKFLTEKLGQMTKLFEEKLQGIEQWKLKMKAKFKISDENIDPVNFELLKDDKEICEKICHRLIENIDNESQKSKIIELFSQYDSELLKREQEIQKLLAKSQNSNQHIEEIKTLKKQNDKKLKVLEQESIKYKTSYSEICISVKSLELQKNEAEKISTNKINTKETLEYEAFLSKNKDVFSSVKKNYGAKMAEKIKADHRKEIGELALIQQQIRRDEIKKQHKILQTANNVLDNEEPIQILENQINHVFL